MIVFWVTFPCHPIHVVSATCLEKAETSQAFRNSPHFNRICFPCTITQVEEGSYPYISNKEKTCEKHIDPTFLFFLFPHPHANPSPFSLISRVPTLENLLQWPLQSSLVGSVLLLRYHVTEKVRRRRCCFRSPSACSVFQEKETLLKD